MFVTLCKRRDKLQKFLEKYKIETRVYYKTPLHLYKATKFLGFKKGSLPQPEKFSDEFLSFPYHQYIKKKEIKFIFLKIN